MVNVLKEDDFEGGKDTGTRKNLLLLGIKCTESSLSLHIICFNASKRLKIYVVSCHKDQCGSLRADLLSVTKESKYGFCTQAINVDAGVTHYTSISKA